MRNSTNTISMKILRRRSGLQTKNRIKLCEKVYSSEEFEHAVAAFFHRPSELVLGCETAQQASERFARTMAQVTRWYVEQNVAVFTHGTVLSLYVARATGIEPFALWKRLGLPSFVVLTLPQCEMRRVIEKMALTPSPATPVPGGR